MKRKHPTSSSRVALVTGSDRGIGLATASEFARLGYRVILTSPDKKRGMAAQEQLKKSGFSAVFHLLDFLNARHVEVLRRFVVQAFGRLDVLVNNAGVMLDGAKSRPDGILSRQFKKAKRLDYGEGPGVLEVPLETVRWTLEINSLGPLQMCQAFIPMMIQAGYGRVINVSSRLGQLSTMTDAEKVPAYQMSKTLLNAVTRMAADSAAGTNVCVNSVCPGWTRTDIGGPEAPQSTQEAAETILWLATLPDGGPSGGFFYQKKPMEW